MLNLASITFRGIFRDKVFRGILMIAIIFLLIPSVSELSMRQVTELSITLSLSLISFIQLLLALFLGGTSLWKDIERRYTYSVLGLPINRTSYVLGKFFAVCGFLLLTAAVLGAVSILVISRSASSYPPDRPVMWTLLLLSLLYDVLKYVLVVAWAFLFSTVSTSFFLPLFGTISVFFVGSATQEVYEYIQSASAGAFSPLFKKAVTVLYYVLPNFTAFDLKVNAIYGIAPSAAGLALTAGYFAVYVAILLVLSSIIYSRRELQ